jgi:hypothetical protein
MAAVVPDPSVVTGCVPEDGASEVGTEAADPAGRGQPDAGCVQAACVAAFVPPHARSAAAATTSEAIPRTSRPIGRTPRASPGFDVASGRGPVFFFGCMGLHRVERAPFAGLTPADAPS